MTAPAPTVVTLEHWRHSRVTAGDEIDRWSLMHDGRAVLTYGTEFEARAAARRYGWVVRTEPQEEGL